jgi:hypothetical protein
LIGIGTSTPGAALGVAGDIMLTKAADRTISVEDSTGAVNGKNLTLVPGASSAGGGNAGNLYLKGAASAAVASGGNIYLQPGLGTSTRGNLLLVDTGGNVGVGMTNPSAKLDVNGQLRAAVFTSGTDSVDFANGNMAVMTANTVASVTTSNMLAGGTYTVVIEQTTSRTYTFSQCTTAYYQPANGPTITGTRSVYTILYSAANTCYISWVTGFQ